MFQITRLNNGLTVATATMPHMASIAVGLWIGVGSRHEPAKLNGVSHFIEHMLFKGTRKRSAQRISEAVEGIGGYLNAFTTEEDTCFYAKAGADWLNHILEVLMDMFLNSTFDPREIEKERAVIKEELDMYRDEPRQHVQDLLNETLWPDHPLGRNLVGTEETVQAMTREQMIEYKRTHYLAGASLIAAAGNVRHDAAVRAVKPFVRFFSDGKRPLSEPVISNQKALRVRLFTKETAQMQMALGIRTCSRYDNRRFALRLLNAILGENMSSRLFQVLRESSALAYSVHSGLTFFDDAGVLEICAGLDTHKLPQALRLTARELRRLAETPPSMPEIRRARDYLIGQLDLSLEGTENMMTWMGEQYLAYGCITPPSEVKKRLSQVTPAQVRSAAREFFRPDRMSLAVVSALKTDRGFAQCLAV
jgi:predicted Zn-dependent peptidase